MQLLWWECPQWREWGVRGLPRPWGIQTWWKFWPGRETRCSVVWHCSWEWGQRGSEWPRPRHSTRLARGWGSSWSLKGIAGLVTASIIFLSKYVVQRSWGQPSSSQKKPLTELQGDETEETDGLPQKESLIWPSFFHIKYIHIKLKGEKTAVQVIRPGNLLSSSSLCWTWRWVLVSGDWDSRNSWSICCRPASSGRQSIMTSLVQGPKVRPQKP